MTNESQRRARRELARSHARGQAGLLTRSQVRALGITADQVRAEIRGERWRVLGRQTLVVAPPVAGVRLDWWLAVLECAPRSIVGTVPRAALGGVTALIACGLHGIADDGDIHIAAPKSSHPVPAPIGVRVHETRRWRDDDVTTEGIVRMTAEAATVQAALWARTDREAALLLVSPIQQRLTSVSAVAGALDLVRRDRRRTLLRGLLHEIDSGVASLNELDFAAHCRRRGLPEPDRQVVVDAGGRAYLDVRWSRWRVTVEIDGIGHLQLDRWVEDSLRHNEIALLGDVVLRIPSLGLRLDPSKHLDAVERALRQAGWRP
ncbi:hypothetical protein [Cellulomonas sp. URHD0024]|uniref:hypothetical protein n=1 Tax=Cellulomonas sp. URHD0024 TaxID=1302620 RepID=UPI0005558701|nr:hypothetical protein [Cellulomonas sp. URHD0024]